MKFPGPSLRRIYLIARRDFVGYVKTWGFWLTVLGPFLGIFFGVLAPFILAKSEPTRYATILDETGQHAAAIERKLDEENKQVLKNKIEVISRIIIPRDERKAFEKLLENRGSDAAKAYLHKKSPIIADHIRIPENKLKFVPPPARTLDALTPYLTGKRTIDIDGIPQNLSGVLHIAEKEGVAVAEFWSTNPAKNELVSLAERYFRTGATESYLKSGGLTWRGYHDARKRAPRVKTLDPTKSGEGEDGQSMTNRDRIPYMFAAALSMVLWFTVFTGANMLLMSMVEEKINKVLEMLLATTRFSEIFIGKLIGVGTLTLAALLPWIILGIIGFYGVINFADSAIADGLTQVISTKMIIFLPIFLILGYVFYGSIFIALGALAESMQDVSTLLTPVVMVLAACILIVPVGIAYPDSPLLTAAQYIPFSAPFAAIIRLPSDPPLWQTLASALILVLSSWLTVWLSARLFRHGVLSGSMAPVKNWFVRIILRRKRAH